MLCLKAQLPVDLAAFDAALADPALWRQWDKDGSGFIDASELVAPGGLAEYVKAQFLRKDGGEMDMQNLLRTNRNAWYALWDEDGSGSLDREEVTRIAQHSIAYTRVARRGPSRTLC
jgi:Ca2+-binding EF-hand superfamily protein